MILQKLSQTFGLPYLMTLAMRARQHRDKLTQQTSITWIYQRIYQTLSENSFKSWFVECLKCRKCGKHLKCWKIMPIPALLDDLHQKKVGKFHLWIYITHLVFSSILFFYTTAKLISVHWHPLVLILDIDMFFRGKVRRIFIINRLLWTVSMFGD